MPGFLFCGVAQMHLKSFGLPTCPWDIALCLNSMKRCLKLMSAMNMMIMIEMESFCIEAFSTIKRI